ncbi:hypothetical protein DFQ26_005816 [Actinomortierella ambigua]|nr:hypothetical protein DFQ26_005816 [Actinomortierella ambigua]
MNEHEHELGSFDEYCGFKVPSDPKDGNINTTFSSIVNNDNDNSNSNGSNNSNTVTLNSSNDNSNINSSSNDNNNNNNNNNDNNSTTANLFDLVPPTPCDPKVDLPADDWYWQSAAQLAQIYSQVTASVLTPELSPATSSFTPSALGTPLGFDSIGLAEVANSPALEFDVTFDNVNYDFAADFQLFPDPPTKSTAAAVPAAAPAPVGLVSDLVVPTIDLGDDPLLAIFAPVKTESFLVAKALGQDVSVPQPGVAPRKPVQSPTKPGFQAAKRRRRRRITTEEAARVVPEDKNDPSAKARFKCFVCNKTFSRPYNLRSHRKIHEGIKPFVCTHEEDDGKICAWAFARKHDLERHVSSRHTSAKTFSCATCGKKCSRNDAYKKHVERHRSKDQSADDQETQECNKVSNL